ncbi:S9 family peptidase [Pyxidicoccus xibeiensis]|uniref:S9 family peptidase n=1 Tax=Pyxidicoccus xibeiensis TaxID=2906759 RepID=UPI0020A73050|nr:S9 family peptidase [Pyxidicoccus xibeiensis]MCP3141685.1 S9 family peptidase [Pyxidicoccus xibeiensis]
MPSRLTVSRTLAALTLLPLLALAAPRPAKPTGAPSLPSKQYTLEQLMETTDVFGASFSPDEKRVLFTSNETGIFNVFSAPVTGGEPTQLTRSTTDATLAVSYFPRDERVLFSRDQAGNEMTHLYVLTPDGQEQDLTPGAGNRASFHGWSHDGSAFYVLSSERDPRYQDLYRYDAKTYARTLLFQNDGYKVGAVSPDEKWLALEKAHTTADSDVHLYNVATKELKHLTPHQGIASWRVATFDPASSALYLLTNEGSEFTRAVRHMLATGKREDVEKADWDVMYLTLSKKGTLRVTGINEHGRAVIRVTDTKTGKPLALPKLPEGGITDVVIARGEKRLAFYVNGDRSPANLYVYDLATKKATRLTDTLSPAIDANDLVVSEVVHFQASDGLRIPGILFKPHQATAEKKAPAIVWAQGGPGDQTYRGYLSFIQYLVHHGYVVLAVNNRGSSGYGKTYFTADDQKHGREPLRDCVEAKGYLTGLPYVDGARVGILGASYGGYMVLAALAFHPDAFNVGVDVFGPSDWVSLLKDLPPHQEAFRDVLYQEMGNPETQEDMLRAISPLFHAEKIRKPLLVIQGANDPRVKKAQSDAIVQAVRKNKVPVDYLVLPDDGHGFGSKKSEAESTERIRTFLDEHLKAPPAAPAAPATPAE